MSTNKGRAKPTVWQDIVPVKASKKTSRKFAPKLRPIISSVINSKYYKTIKKVFSNAIFRRAVKYSIYIVILLGFYITTTKPTDVTQTPKNTSSQSGLVRGSPSYKTLLPLGRDIADLGGWIRPGDKTVYIYIDRIGGVAINVSQQPLPDNFVDDPYKELEDLATSENATQKITVGNSNVYIGTSAKGPQSILFIKNNLLILIKSASKIDNDQWAKYINSLQ